MKNFYKILRKKWAKLSNDKKYLTFNELTLPTSLSDVVNINDINEIYLPLVKYLNIFIQNKKMVFCIKDNFVGLDSIQPPFIIGISGPVAVGKSTTARLLQVLLMYCYPNLNVQLMTTDGFLYSNKELKKKD